MIGREERGNWWTMMLGKSLLLGGTAATVFAALINSPDAVKASSLSATAATFFPGLIESPEALKARPLDCANYSCSGCGYMCGCASWQLPSDPCNEFS